MRLGPCDRCGESIPGRKRFLVGWAGGRKGEVVLCQSCGRGLMPFLALLAKPKKADPIRTAPTEPHGLRLIAPSEEPGGAAEGPSEPPQ